MKKELTDKKFAELKKNATKILENCRTSILEQHPFIGSVMMSFNIYPIRTTWCNTACTDGNAIYFDIDFLSNLNDQERKFILAHEIWHNIMMHFLRLEERDKELYNYATDIEVNEILVDDGFTAPKNALLASTFNFPRGKSAEEYYEMLLKCSQRPNAKPLDMHFYNGDKLTDEERTDRYGKVNTDCTCTLKIDKNAVEKIRESVVSAAQQIEKSKGELPAYLKKIVGSILLPKLSWKELLAARITSSIGSHVNWNRPNRRFAYSGTYLPSSSSEKLKIAIGIDTSGSCSEDFDSFITEVIGIAKTFGEYEIHVIECDTEVKKYELFDESNPIDIENEPIEFIGNGGTILKPVFDYIEENELDIDMLVMFTDGFCEHFKEEDKPETYDVLWVITSNGTQTDIEFGEKIVLE